MRKFNILFNDNNARLFAILIIIVFHCNGLQLTAQEWAEPVNISNLGGYSRESDIVIDNSGIIHIVWEYRIEDNFWKIMYSRSEDNGEIWSEPIDLLQNNYLWMSQPNIACDSENHLYVTYTFDAGNIPEMLIKMVIYDGHQWSEPILVSEGMPGSDYNKVVVDNYDRVFVFWGYQNINIKYRIYQNNSFGKILEPYYNSLNDYYWLYYYAIDSMNNIHWVGYTTEGMPTGTYAHAYYLFEPEPDTWGTPWNISVGNARIGNDIDLSLNDLVQVVIREDTTNWPNPYDDITFFLGNNGFNWLPPESVSNSPGSQAYQQITNDQYDKVHVVEQQKIAEGYGLVHYKKYNENWTGQFIDSCYIVNFPKLLFKNNQLYLVYSKTWVVEKSFMADLFFTKYDILTHIPEAKHTPTALQLFPNPASHSVTIAFEVEQQHVTVSVLDIAGKPIKQVINTVLPSGAHSFTWNGTDNSGRPVKSGTYLVQLQTKQGSATQAVEIAR